MCLAMWILYSVQFQHTQMRCRYLVSELGILTVELLKITIPFLTPDFLKSLAGHWSPRVAGLGYTV